MKKQKVSTRSLYMPQASYPHSSLFTPPQQVKLMNQMRSDASQRKADDARRSREVAMLKKETRKKEHRIKSLEADARKRELVLKRRQEQVGW